MEVRKWIVIVLELCQVLSMYVEIQRHSEFEDILADTEDEFWVWRSEASHYRTLRLVDFDQRYRAEFNICIDPVGGENIVTLYLDDIRYANDGPDDFIYVTLDGEYWDSYPTYEKWAHGHEWNIFRNTGRVNETKYLPRGEYVLGVSVRTDQWGLELDKIRLIAEYQTLSTSLFCGGRLVDTYVARGINGTD